MNRREAIAGMIGAVVGAAMPAAVRSASAPGGPGKPWTKRIIGHAIFNSRGVRRTNISPHVDHIELLKLYADRCVQAEPIFAGDWLI